MKKHSGLKSYFMQVFSLDEDIKKQAEDIETLQALQYGPGGSLVKMSKKTANNRRGEDLAVAVLEAQAQLTKAKINLLSLEKEIKTLADTLPDSIYRAIITWRYICRYMWKDIAWRAEMSEMQVIREHNTAMAAMEERAKQIEKPS